MTVERQVRITVRGIQWDEAGNEAVTETASPGEFFERGGKLYLLYEEETPDAGAVKNRIAFWDGQMEITKKGAVSARMVFERGRTHMTDYATPYGILKLGVMTSAVSCVRSGEWIEIRARYALTDGETVLSECEIVIAAES